MRSTWQMIKLFYVTNIICFCIILSAIHKCDQQPFCMYFYIVWKISNTVRPSTDVSKDSVKYPVWRFFNSKKCVLEIYLEFFSAKIHSIECFVLLLPCSATVLLFFKSTYLWFSSGQFKEAEYIIFCYLSVSIKLLLSAENEVGFILLSAWFPLSHWFSVMILLSFSFFWSNMQVNIFIILSRLDVTNWPANMCVNGTFPYNSN